MKPKIYITKKIPSAVERYLSSHCIVDKWDSSERIPRNVLLEKVSEIDGLLTHGGKIDDELFRYAPKLKIVSNISVGYDNFDIEAMKRRGIIGTNTPGVLDETVADLIFALILSAGRRIVELDKMVKERKWDKLVGEDLYGIDIHHTTLGIIGMGRIGEAIARRARFGFDMDILYCNRTPKPQAEKVYAAKYCALDEILQTADFVVLLTPLTEQTVNLMSEREFSLMKNSAIFINASRGETVDEEALAKALGQGVIRAAALDVYRKEPIQFDNPLFDTPNLITVPHIGSAVQKTRDAMALLAAENLVKGLFGEKPPNMVKELDSEWPLSVRTV
jgi:gluconate 2-dehydrogenase